MTHATIINLINDAKKYDESFFLCNAHGRQTEALAAEHGGKVIRTTEPTQPCSVCGQQNSRLEYRAN